MTSQPDGDDAATTPNPLRASDADRHATVAQLQDAVARGLLTPDECSERLAAAYAARHQHELPPLTADLPPAPALAPTAPGWRPLASLAVLQAHSSAATLMAGGLRSRRTLAVLAALLVAVVLLVALGAMTFGALFGDGHGHGHGRF
jgi:hypothetical protein